MASASSSSSGTDDAGLQEELAALRVFRATLESVKQLVEAIHRDTETAARNYEAVTGLERRWKAAMEESRGVAFEEDETMAAQEAEEK